MEYKSVVFISYTRFDDDIEHGLLTRFRTELSRALRFLSGGEIEILSNVRDIVWGEAMQEHIEQALNEAVVLMPLITPSYFVDQWCRRELTRFLEREQQLGHHDLIKWVYYHTVPTLDAAMKQTGGTQLPSDPLIQTIAQHPLLIDWRPLRGKDFREQEVRRELERIAQHIITLVEDLKKIPVES